MDFEFATAKDWISLGGGGMLYAVSGFAFKYLSDSKKQTADKLSALNTALANPNENTAQLLRDIQKHVEDTTKFVLNWVLMAGAAAAIFEVVHFGAIYLEKRIERESMVSVSIPGIATLDSIKGPQITVVANSTGNASRPQTATFPKQLKDDIEFDRLGNVKFKKEELNEVQIDISKLIAKFLEAKSSNLHEQSLRDSKELGGGDGI